MAKLYMRYGAMSSGKSAILQQVAHNYEEQGMKVKVIKPSIDTRVQGCVTSRIGLTRKVDYDVSECDSLEKYFSEIVNEG